MTTDVTMQTIELYDAARAFKAAVNQYAFTQHCADHITYQQTGAAFNAAALETMAQLPYSEGMCNEWRTYDLAAGAFARYLNYGAAEMLVYAVTAVTNTLLEGLAGVQTPPPQAA